MRTLGLVAAAASLLVAGCTILHSSGDETVSGIPYYLPKSIIVAEVKINKRGSDYFLEFDTSNNKTRGEAIPDQGQRFHLTYNNNPFYNDRYCISTDANNLLESIEYATEDATPQIALTLAALAQKGPEAFAATVAEEVKTVDTVRVTFDPFDWRQTKAAEEAIIAAYGGAVKFDFPGLPRFNKGRTKGTCRSDKGVCFRARVKVPMQLTNPSGKALTTSVLVDVVNVEHTGNFDLDRTFMVEKVVRLGFEGGALTQVIMRKPSEALETVKVPLAIVDAILAVPANFAAKAGGNTAALNTALQAQQTTLTALQTQLATAMTTNTFNQEVYKEKCKGRVFNKPSG